MKASERWYSERLEREISLVRWGAFGTPVLLFPTAGGDADEVERMGVVEACGGLLADGRIKLYSCDSVAGQALANRQGSPEHRMWLMDRFHACIAEEVAPAIRADSGGGPHELVAAGASIGAFNAIAVLCRYPQVFSHAIGMSGTYDLQPLLDGRFTDHLYFASPLHFLPGLEGEHLDQLRRRFAIIASGEGAWENIGESWRMAEALGNKGVPNRVDAWGPDFEHDWPTWHRMLPQYLDELSPSA